MTNNRPLSTAAFRQAQQLIPGGVNSPVRALRSVGATPLFVDHALGSTITDIDGNRFIDFCLSWGVFIVGHANEQVLESVRAAIGRGTSYGIPCQAETELARLVNSLVPSMEQVRFVNSGTEAVMSAIRLARGFTGRDKVVKFVGCYHGHVDSLLVQAGSGVATLGISSSAGVPQSFVEHTVCLPFNDRTAVADYFERHGHEVAAVIVEPVPANMGVVPAVDDFLRLLRELTTRHGALLIFDEVITGFRLARGGAQEVFGIRPDLTTVGKIVGGGFPCAAFGGRRDVMQLLAPCGPVYQAGTLSGNPVAMAAGIATLSIIGQPSFHAELNRRAEAFISELSRILRPKGITVNSAGSMFTPFFTEQPVRNFDDVNACDTLRFASFFRHMLAHGVYLSPSQFETNFLSAAHTDDQLSLVLRTAASFED